MATLQETVNNLRKLLVMNENLLEKQKREAEEKEEQSWEHNFEILKNIYVGHVINLRRIKEKYNKPINNSNRWDNLLLQGPQQDIQKYQKLKEVQKLKDEAQRMQQKEQQCLFINQYKDKHKFNHHESIFKCFQRLDDRLKSIDDRLKKLE